jgi:hypothetical protein
MRILYDLLTLRNIHCSMILLNMQTNAELQVPSLNRVEVRGKFL